MARGQQRTREGARLLAVSGVALGLLAAHAVAGLLHLPALGALDLADRMVSVAGIAALTLGSEQALRRGRRGALPLVLLAQSALLVGPPLLHAEAIGATYDPRVLLAGSMLQAVLSLTVVAAALRLRRVVLSLLLPGGALPSIVRPRVTGRPCAVPARRSGRRPTGRGPPQGLPAPAA